MSVVSEIHTSFQEHYYAPANDMSTKRIFLSEKREELNYDEKLSNTSTGEILGIPLNINGKESILFPYYTYMHIDMLICMSVYSECYWIRVMHYGLFFFVINPGL